MDIAKDSRITDAADGNDAAESRTPEPGSNWAPDADLSGGDVPDKPLTISAVGGESTVDERATPAAAPPAVSTEADAPEPPADLETDSDITGPEVPGTAFTLANTPGWVDVAQAVADFADEMAAMGDEAPVLVVRRVGEPGLVVRWPMGRSGIWSSMSVSSAPIRRVVSCSARQHSGWARQIG